LKLADFGFSNGINEIIAVTRGKNLNTAPIGIIVEDENSVFAKARLYPSHTRENVKVNCKLWANVVVDPIIFTISAFEDLGEEYFLPNKPVLKDALAYCEFEVKLKNSVAHLKLLHGEVINCSFRAVNRGFNVLIEALVHATRYRINRENRRLREKILYYGEIIQKCGSNREKKAFDMILEYLNIKV